MNAPLHAPDEGDTYIIACDAILELAVLLNGESAALIAGASAVDPAAVEVKLWACRRALTSAIASWREFVPPPTEGEAP